MTKRLAEACMRLRLHETLSDTQKRRQYDSGGFNIGRKVYVTDYLLEVNYRWAVAEVLSRTTLVSNNAPSTRLFVCVCVCVCVFAFALHFTQ